MSGSRGFTLIELMVTVAIAAVLMVVATPSFIQYQRNSELTSVANSLLASINASRSEALKRGRSALVKPTGTGWAGGWIVFVDMNGDSVYTEGVDVLVQKQDAVKSYFSIAGNNIASGSSPYMRFDSSGYSTDNALSPVALALTISRTDVTSAEQVRRVVVARTGRVRVCNPGIDTTCTSSATQ
jgi:type IV fimbrial biogenesis protein FimT